MFGLYTENPNPKEASIDWGLSKGFSALVWLDNVDADRTNEATRRRKQFLRRRTKHTRICTHGTHLHLGKGRASQVLARWWPESRSEIFYTADP